MKIPILCFLKHFSLLLALIAFFHVTTTAAWARTGQEIFKTPEAALAALKEALSNQDTERLTEIFGDLSEEIFDTGDPEADKAALKRLSIRFQQRAELMAAVNADYDKEQWYKVRYGKEGWHMHVPLVNRGKGWLFATEYASDADLRIRRALNEVTTVDTLRALARAQLLYKKKDHNGDGTKEYAKKLLSDSGNKNGLYWKAKNGEELSPLDGLVARALKAGYTEKDSKIPSYEGYNYKILYEQGHKTRGGAKSYLKDGKLTEGFAILAWPVEWRASGDLSFLVGENLQIWQKDLGIRTDSIASGMDIMQRDSLWVRSVPHLGGKNSRTNW